MALTSALRQFFSPWTYALTSHNEEALVFWQAMQWYPLDSLKVSS